MPLELATTLGNKKYGTSVFEYEAYWANRKNVANEDIRNNPDFEYQFDTLSSLEKARGFFALLTDTPKADILVRVFEISEDDQEGEFVSVIVISGARREINGRDFLLAEEYLSFLGGDDGVTAFYTTGAKLQEELISKEGEAYRLGKFARTLVLSAPTLVIADTSFVVGINV